MSKNFKGTTGPGGVDLDPNGFWERISPNTTPTAPDDGIGMWVRREGDGYVGFGGRGTIFLFAPNSTPNNVEVWVDYSTHTYWMGDPNGSTDSGVSSVLNQWDHVALDIDGGATTSQARLIINGTQVLNVTFNWVWPSLFGFLLCALTDAFNQNKFDGSIVAPITYQGAQGSNAATYWNTQRTTGFSPVSATNEFSYVRMAAGGSATADTSGNGNDYATNGTSQDGAAPEPTFASTGSDTLPSLMGFRANSLITF